MLSQLAACSSGADAAVKEAMQEPIFLELASACLRVVEPEKFETEKFEAEQYDWCKSDHAAHFFPFFQPEFRSLAGQQDWSSLRGQGK